MPLKQGNRTQAWERSSRCPGGIYRVFSHTAGEWVFEADGVGMNFRKHGFQQVCERFFRGIVRPQGEHPAGIQVSGKFSQAFGCIKPGIGPVQNPVGGVVDVQKNEILLFPGKIRIKSLIFIPAPGEKSS